MYDEDKTMATDNTYSVPDVSDASTPEEAAERTHAALQDLAESVGYNPDDVLLWDAETAEGRVGHAAPTVAWTGLYEWTMALVGGESAMSRELGRFGGAPEIEGLYDADNFSAEPYTGSMLQFFEAY
jgi:hypothetical protein